GCSIRCADCGRNRRRTSPQPARVLYRLRDMASGRRRPRLATGGLLALLMMTGAPVGAWQSPGSSAAPGPTTTAATVGTGEQSDQPDTVSPETTADDGNEPQLSRIVSPHTLERIRRALEADESPDLQL